MEQKNDYRPTGHGRSKKKKKWKKKMSNCTRFFFHINLSTLISGCSVLSKSEVPGYGLTLLEALISIFKIYILDLLVDLSISKEGGCYLQKQQRLGCLGKIMYGVSVAKLCLLVSDANSSA